MRTSTSSPTSITGELPNAISFPMAVIKVFSVSAVTARAN
jgi:hypothetical protein